MRVILAKAKFPWEESCSHLISSNWLHTGTSLRIRFIVVGISERVPEVDAGGRALSGGAESAQCVAFAQQPLATLANARLPGTPPRGTQRNLRAACKIEVRKK